MKLLFCFFLVVTFNVSAQNFVNGDLEDDTTSSMNPPPFWEYVPYGDVNCIASGVLQATADITNIFGPVSFAGLCGNPYSGYTFVSGLLGGNESGGSYHEGIMQTVSGFQVNDCYTISFYQSVVKQQSSDYLDTSGCWAVYLDNDLIGITAPTVSHAVYNSTSFVWNFRQVSFTATSTTHTIKFLPHDDDSDQICEHGEGGALRMGIDLISLSPGCQDTITGQNPNTVLLELPNVITPNHDETNDLFTPVNATGIVSMHTTICNRWGIEVFETNDPLIKWDGDGVNEGVYFWLIRYTDVSGSEKELHGSVTLIK